MTTWFNKLVKNEWIDCINDKKNFEQMKKFLIH